MPETRPLPIYGEVTATDRAQLIRAKAEINPPYLLTVVEAYPDSPGRVLALRSPLPHNAEYYLVTNPEDYAQLRLALYWALHPEFDSPAAHLATDPLYAVFGPNVKEIYEKPHFE
ncbi:hypothetical protein [Frigoribacterium sp. UYMn621]|uniref:hypothetical protein n=1 Tax=Frigoribacterium sp. UYMn621 TaxID=3156343 RepID=UPI0033999215